MVDLTVVILTKNEEQNIEKCIRSFKGIARRFVIVDSFSTDQTKEVCEALDTEARTLGFRVDFYQNAWVNYATQFNWGISKTDITTEWVMRFDADEELLPELAVEIDKRLPLINDKTNGVILRRRMYFMGRFIRHGGRYPELLLRIFRRETAICEQKIMDEHLLLLCGNTITFKNDFIDRNEKELSWWIAKHNWYSNREVLDFQMTQKRMIDESLSHGGTSSEQAVIKRKIKNNGYYKLPKFWRAHLYFLYRYYIRLGFLDGPEGKIYHFLQAYWYRFLVDAKMYECEKYNKPMEPQGDLKA